MKTKDFKNLMLNGKNRILAATLVVVVLFSSLVFVNKVNAEELDDFELSSAETSAAETSASKPEISPSDATIFVNQKQIVFDVQPQIINGRLMIQFRKIGEALGASVSWDGELRKVSMVLDTKSIEVFVGNEILTHGTLESDSNGTFLVNPSTRKAVTLDAAPVIVNDYLLVPLRAISEGFGATVNWDPTTAIATVMTEAAVPQNVTKPTTDAPENPLFATTEYFQKISGSRAQDMKSGKEKFILMYYDSSDSVCVEKMEYVKRAAEQAKVKVFGVDVSTSQSLDRLKWIYTEVSSPVLPTLFFNYYGGDVHMIESPVSSDEVYTKMTQFVNNLKVTPTPTPTQTPVPTLAPNYYTSNPGTVTDGSYFYYLNRYSAQSRYEQNDKFVFVYYNSRKSNDYLDSMDIIKRAANNTATNIYYFDFAGDETFWFGNEYYPYSADLPNPIVFFVYGNNSVSYSQKPINITTFEKELDDFRRNTIYQ